MTASSYIIEAFRARYPFALDAFQEEAIATLAAGDSAMVAAPTGTGKTVVAEFAIYKAALAGQRVMYTTPIKALSNQKFRDLRAIYGAASVGLLTGDIIENREGRILVMTTEVLRNMLLQNPAELEDVSVVIFDEVHYLADVERGTAWEEAIILCPKHVQLVCLSATVANAAELAAWISHTHSPVHLITHRRRAVPLSYYYYLDGQMHKVIDERGRQVADFPNVGGEVRRGGGRGTRDRGFGNDGERRRIPEPEPPEIVQQLEHLDLLPAIYFLFSRRDCEAAAEACAQLSFPSVLEKEHVKRVGEIIQRYMDRLNPEDRQLEQVKTIVRLARRGLAYHHAGLLPVLKQLVEELFGQALLRAVFATDTLALGVNMPARTVVIGRMSKYDGQTRRPLLPNEFQQMAGRAGRRGIDPQGYIVIPYSPWVTFREAVGIAMGDLLPVESAFSIHYNAVLSLWNPPTGSRVLDVMRHSLLQFQQSRRLRELATDLYGYQARLADIPVGCLIGYPEGEALLDEYERLGREVSIERKREKAAAEELERVRIKLNATPWTPPRRDSLRHTFRELAPGSPIHLAARGWAFWLGKGEGNGIGLLLAFADGKPVVETLTEYRHVDYLPEQAPLLALPIELDDPPYTPVAQELLTPAQQEALYRDAQELIATLPDLEQWREEHNAALLASLSPALDKARAEMVATATAAKAAAAAVHHHPCDPCPRRKEHRAYRYERTALVGQIAKEEGKIAEAAAEEEVRLERTLQGIVRVLDRFDYLDRGQPSSKALRLANIFDRNALIITEAVVAGWLDALSPADLAEFFSWFAFDRDVEFNNRYYIPSHLVALRRRLDELEREVFKAERENGLLISSGYNPYFWGAARDWCRGASLGQLMRNMEQSEGDLVMTMNKTLDLLRQLREMLATVERSTGLADPLQGKLREAEKLIRRGVVELATTAGFGPLSEDTRKELEVSAAQQNSGVVTD
ncbi:MAG: DNA helicase [Candidatus Chloroheliales bacterium]|nr:MAG: DNA helicase [Chloroflexota bacterium]